MFQRDNFLSIHMRKNLLGDFIIFICDLNVCIYLREVFLESLIDYLT